MNVHCINDARQTEINTAEPLVSEPTAFEFELAVEELSRQESLGRDEIPKELFKAVSRKFRYEIHKLIISIWNKEEFSEEWKESIIVPVYKKGDKTDSSNYGGISLLSTTYKIFSNILLSRLNPYAEEIIGDYQCEFRRKMSATDHTFCIRPILEKKWEHNETMH